jgi:hypothetical protein
MQLGHVRLSGKYFLTSDHFSEDAKIEQIKAFSLLSFGNTKKQENGGARSCVHTSSCLTASHLCNIYHKNTSI